MRVLGIDPGSRFLGFGVVEERRGAVQYVSHGVIRADPRATLELRLAELFESLTLTVEKHRPEAVAVEGVFTFRNARSALVLGHARGVALLVAARTGVPVYEYSPARVKKSVGAGGADGKDAVARMVSVFLKHPPLERSDASDALAVAICHLNRGRFAVPGAARTKSRRSALATIADRLSPSFRPPVGTP